MYSIRHILHINAPKHQVFDALSTVSGLSKWWTVHTRGKTDLHGELTFQFNGPYVVMKVVEIQSPNLLKWEVVDGNFDWEHHRLQFQLEESEGKTRVSFHHENWQENDVHYASCNFSWGRYLASLRKYCEQGEGNPFD